MTYQQTIKKMKQTAKKRRAERKTKFFGLTEKEKEEVVKKAAKLSNKDQLKFYTWTSLKKAL